jgi:hypothetical protein
MQGSNEATIFAEELIQLVGLFERIFKKDLREAGPSQPDSRLPMTMNGKPRANLSVHMGQ